MKIFGFIKKVFFTGLTILSSFINTIPMRTASLNTTRLTAVPLSCISMNNQSCKARPEIANVNNDNPIFYPFRASGNWNNIKDPYAEICVPAVLKELNVKVFNLISRTNETKKYKMACNVYM